MDRRQLGMWLVLIVGVGAVTWAWYSRPKPEAPPPPPSHGLKIGDWLREFDVLNDLDHPEPKQFPRAEKGTVVMFWHVQCPAVLAVHPRFEALRTKYAKRGFNFVVIDSEPLDDIDDVKARRLELKATYPVWRDNKRATAKLLGVDRAATFLVFDHEARLVYRGAFDDGLRPPKTGYVHQALSAILADTEAAVLETRSRGTEYTEPTP